MNIKGEKLLESVFDEFMKNGSNMFNATRFASTENEHIKIYYDFMQPKSYDTIVDLGCGIGEYGAKIQMIDPTIRVLNVVNDDHLIGVMSELGRYCINRSYIDTGLPNNIADIVMFNESIGYESLSDSLCEAFRLLKYGGSLFIKDFSVTKDNSEGFFLDEWGYRIHKDGWLISNAENIGFNLKSVVHPPVFIKHWYEIMDNSECVKQSADLHNPDGLPLCTVVYEFKKGGLNGKPVDR